MSTGSRNTYVGATIVDQSSPGTATGTHNTIVGADSARYLTSGGYNSFLGVAIAESATTAEFNTAAGGTSLNALTTGSNNTAFGYGAGDGITTNSSVVAIGYRAGRKSGAESVWVGTNAGGETTGTISTSGSVGIGYDALVNATSYGNVAVGSNTGKYITIGQNNTFIGRDAGASGYNMTTGTNNTVIGYGSDGSSATVSNEITLGNTSVDKFRIPGINFIIKDSTATEDYVLTVDANGEAGWEAAAGGGATDINGLSDALTNSSGITIGLGTNCLVNDDGSSNRNTGLGYTALQQITTGNQNVGIGYRAGNSLTTVQDSVVIGHEAAETATTAGGYDVIIGSGAAKSCADHDEAVVIGWNAGGSSTNMSSSVFIGAQAAQFGDGNGSNVGIGKEAFYGVNGSPVTGYGNVALGRGSMYGAKNEAIGNTALGAYTLDLVDGGDYNTAVGYDSGDSITTGSNNTVIGNGADASSATVSNEITLGNTSVDKFRIPGINFTVKDSTATEDYVLTVDANGEAGWEAAAAGGATDIDGLSDGVTNSSGGTVGLGTEALLNDDGSANQNTALGYQALRTTNSNFANTAVGYRAGYALTGTGDTNYGRDSSLFGTSAGVALTTGRGNTAFGAGALDGATTPDNNAAFGREAGGSVTTGASNVFVGPDAGYTTTTGSNNIILGNAAEASSATVSNEITLGNSSISSLRCQVQTISSLSDRRDKKDIEELPLGVDFINTLKPVKFTWNMRDGAKVGQQEAGFIAQDLDKAQIDADAEDYLSLVLKNNPEKLEASYGKLVPVLVKAVQELSAEIATLKKEIENGK
jgi:hypothetical protein